jgi:ABC-type nickel/cobalt efflux system permease component RcnA
MMTALSIIALGFFLGMRHATDPDHVIAVSTIVTRQRTVRDAVVMGGLWGIGHTLTVIAVGGAIIMSSIVIPPRLGLTFEMIVAVMLVTLGLWNLTGIIQRIRDTFLSSGQPGLGLHRHVHSHGDYSHTHRHGHDQQTHGHAEDQTPQAWLDRRLGRLGIYNVLRPLLIGIVHGLAGSAGVALLVLATIQDPWSAIAYLGLFGVGTIVGMLLITAAIAAPFAYASKRLTRLERHLRVASGLLSLGFGLFLVYQVGIVNGLFTHRPRWRPE